MDVAYDPETDTLRLRLEPAEEPGGGWRADGVLFRLEEIDGERYLSVRPFREGWRRLLAAVPTLRALATEAGGWVDVSSSMIRAVRYDPERRVLEVAFNKGVYVYYEVPPEVFEGLLQADSKGRYMRDRIIDCYPWIRKDERRRGGPGGGCRALRARGNPTAGPQP